jgi:hypothetical protein
MAFNQPTDPAPNRAGSFRPRARALSYIQVWRAARALALVPEQVVPPLAGCPYDLRHAAMLQCLNARLPVTYRCLLLEGPDCEHGAFPQVMQHPGRSAEGVGFEPRRKLTRPSGFHP